MTIEHRPVITAAELNPIVDRLAAIWRLDQERSASPRDLRATGFRVVTVSEMMRRAPVGRIESVRDAGSGLRYSVWIVGETIARLAGMEAVHSTYALFEDQHGTRASAWLNSAWNGISDGTAIWSS